MSTRRFLLLITLITLAALIFLVRTIPPDGDFLAFNPRWNGIKELAQRLDAETFNYSSPPSSSTGKLLVIFPYTPYSRDELATLEDFVRSGGILFLANDYGYGNKILEKLDSPVRFSSHTLLDPLLCYRESYFPKLMRITPVPLTTGVNLLVLNHAAVLENVTPENKLAESSYFSFLDTNNNGKLDAGEAQGPFTVLAAEKLSSGQLVMLSDPSLFLNSMLKLGDNSILVQNISLSAPEGVLLDDAHLPDSNLSLARNILASFLEITHTTLASIIILFTLLALLTVLLWPPTGRSIFRPRGVNHVK